MVISSAVIVYNALTDHANQQRTTLTSHSNAYIPTEWPGQLVHKPLLNWGRPPRVHEYSSLPQNSPPRGAGLKTHTFPSVAVGIQRCKFIRSGILHVAEFASTHCETRLFLYGDLEEDKHRTNGRWGINEEHGF